MDSQYHKNLTAMMDRIALIENSLFIGQQTAAENFYGTLRNVPMAKRLEMPVAEELQLGMCLGMSLEGILPISIYQRMDFLPRAFDQLVNHLDLTETLSRGLFKPKVIIRVTVGLSGPLDVGLQHKKDLTECLESTLHNIAIFKLARAEQIEPAYEEALNSDKSSILIEYQDKYNE